MRKYPVLLSAALLITGLSACSSQEPASAPTTAAPMAMPSPVTDVAYTMEDVAMHGTPDDCWTMVAGNVYDLTQWISLHPGGEAVIESVCGRDGSGRFLMQHGSQRDIFDLLGSFQVGYLAESAEPSTDASASPAAS